MIKNKMLNSRRLAFKTTKAGAFAEPMGAGAFAELKPKIFAEPK